MDDFKLNDDTMRDLRRIAQSPGEFEWRMELLAKLERINARHDLFVRAAVNELKRLDREKLGPIAVTKLVNKEIDERQKVSKGWMKRMERAAIWLLERAALLGFAYLGIKLGLKH